MSTILQCYKHRLAVPVMTPFFVPPGATIESMKDRVTMSSTCLKNLTTTECGQGVSVRENLAGGFFPMSADFYFEAGVEAVGTFARTTNRKFRLGTQLEALAYKLSEAAHPKRWVVLKVNSSGEILYWCPWQNTSAFCLSNLHVVWGPDYSIFIVEDVGDLIP